jgi:hypothetical protein
VEELKPVEELPVKNKIQEPEFVDVVGQISLKSLEKASKRRKHRQKKSQEPGKKNNP